MPPASCFLKICLAVWGPLCCNAHSRARCSSSERNAVGVFTEVAPRLCTALGGKGICVILTLPTTGKVCPSVYLYLLRFFSSTSYSFPNTGLSPLWLNSFLGILYFLMPL